CSRSSTPGSSCWRSCSSGGSPSTWSTSSTRASA
ncbi:MAG: hypothetical protein AVDCRST_MAG07-2990, partial [uncultured Frankineae bacterium]